MASRAQPGLLRETVKAGAVRGGALVAAIALFVATAVMVLALASYRASDAALNTASGGPVQNLAGPPGAWFADLALTLFGPAVALLLPIAPIVAARLWRDRPAGRWLAMLRNAAIGVALIAAALAFVSDASVLALPAGWGGVAGLSIAKAVEWGLSFIGQPGAERWAARGIGLIVGIAGIVIWAKSLDIDLGDRRFRLRRTRGDAIGADDDGDDLYDDAYDDGDEEPLQLARKVVEPRAIATPDPRPAPNIADRNLAPSAAKPKPKQQSLDLGHSYTLPQLDLLTPAPPAPKGTIDKASLERNARLLENVLDDFKVHGVINEVRPGPVVTMYELEPAPGIKASRVIALADDIARNMSAISARVAVIPGRNVIGIELPNQKRESVSLHELVGSQTFEDQAAQLPIILGKNIAGDPVIADLAPMPHLLVAGTTGSGKSVGLNCMILSLLYRLTPEQCRMIMIDPKMLELSMYDDIPHLLSPVVTDPAKAVRALKWAVETMEDRYRQMSSVGVRSLAGFNDKVRAAKAKGQRLGRRVQTGYHPDTGQPVYEEEQLDYEPLPQIVVIVDELADLMMTAGKEVEFLIQRLAQKARAAGIHLIMATQRPSVDVITGVIKANLPTRISFHVTSKIDSRTILGEQGAEQLLGRGDMLYMPGGKGIVRVHGPFVSDDEVRAIADHWRAQGQPDYISSVTEEPEDSFALDGAPEGEDTAEDQQYRAAIQLVCESQKASTSWLQRQLRIGYNSAARLIERMEKDGIVGRPDHVGRREVLRDTEGHAI
ncbi:cell division protein FtsK [Sphingomonas melonis TY]|jgi:DNA segregation ATPase FtsK/SpoIIIE, S-DNA-T family|uniref:DNA translocase FtsK n=2 Tax=Sphingomonas melonis TaxID=152682 RepID=A0A175Y3N5_9SPHN|nr:MULTISPECIES: DNA translocase FtsK [Sphingomonas]AOW22704.1 cell division protein FtsK [Sphingomonas melonis TY]ATI56107.1 DNA translocase FtsK [Sphingomonas melonis]KZB95372.1 cell division protein FtsK [Sphingomonas melonis TY]MBI0530734.1 DNA translocase FtsK [Sphingomonas sp. TX0522]MBX8845182.1 DNA translocase FtsK [Sphingomonas melonis]